jgi:hypothetical protein
MAYSTITWSSALGLGMHAPLQTMLPLRVSGEPAGAAGSAAAAVQQATATTVINAKNAADLRMGVPFLYLSYLRNPGKNSCEIEFLHPAS